MERTRAISFICFATFGHRSAIWTPGAAVSMALASPPVGVPGLGSNVSNWLGPPCMNSRMQARPRLRNSPASAFSACAKPRPAAAEARKPRRLTSPSRPRRTNRSGACMGEVLLAWPAAPRRFGEEPPRSGGPRWSALRAELRGVDQRPQDVLEGGAAVAQRADVLQADALLALARAAAQRPQVQLLHRVGVLGEVLQDARQHR